VLSVLSGKSVRIDGIRADQLEVGVKGEGMKRWLPDISSN
jgi:RNA 3'-terminal phosphate cyclase